MKEHSGQADRRRTGKRIDRQPPVPRSEGHVQFKSVPSPAEASPGSRHAKERRLQELRDSFRPV